MKKLTGTLIKRKGTWHVLLRPNGKAVPPIDLETDDLARARAAQPVAVRQFLKGMSKQVSKRDTTLKVPGITMRELASDYYKKRELQGVKEFKTERRWWTLWAQPHLGDLPPKSLNVGLIEDVLLKAADSLAYRSLGHIVDEIRALLMEAKKLGHLPMEFPVIDMIKLVHIPDGQGTEKQRETLEADEWLQYVAHPDTYEYSEVENAKRKAAGQPQLISREIKVMAIIARAFGCRSQEVHLLDWKNYDGNTLNIYRPKVSRRGKAYWDRYQVREDIAECLQEWREHLGGPTSGPVFPQVLAGHFKEGKRVYDLTKFKGTKSHARALRRDLLAAGITRHEVHHETEETRPVDFHSLRRTLATAMDDLKIPAAERQKVMHHSSEAQTNDYVNKRRKAPIKVPDAAVPRISGRRSVQASKPNTDDSANDSKSSVISRTQSNLRQFVRDNSNRVTDPAPPQSLALTGTYGVTEPGDSVEARGIEPRSARHRDDLRSRA